MRIYEKDYRYLLLHLVPRHRLTPARRRRVEQALDSGDTYDLRRESVRALEELCASDYLERVDVRSENGDVIVDYKKTGGRFRLSVAMPSQEWSALTAGAPVEPASRTEPAPEPPAPPTPQTEAAALERRKTNGLVEYHYVTDILNSFAVADRSEPVLSRLESLVETLCDLADVVGIRLFVLEDVTSGQETRSDVVQVVSDPELRASAVLRTAIETGAQRLHARDELTADECGHAGEEGSWSVVGVAPIYSLGKVRGALCMMFPPGVAREAMASRLELTADTLRRVIEYHTQIENMTSIDALTGIYNRHFFDDQMPVEIERATRSGNALSMLVIDLDDFKRVNDELGHKKGDEALSAVAEIIRRNLRKVDLPFRYGGEEFVILLPGTSELESVHTAERLRRVIADYDGFKDHHGRPRRMTVSVGVSVYPETARTADQLFTQADAAMYQAKQQGKNRVVLYREDKEDDGG